MRLLTFNLWHGLMPSSPLLMEPLEPTARRLLRQDMQYALIKALRPDICFFQEVNPLKARTHVFEQKLHLSCTGQLDLVGIKVLGIGVPLNLNSGLLTTLAERRSQKEVDAVSLSRPGPRLVHEFASWQLREERFALFSETMWPGCGKVLLVNTHLHHGLEVTNQLMADLDRLSDELELSASVVSDLKERLNQGNQRRLQELKALLAAMDRYQHRFETVILGGDFNASPENPMFELLRERGFRDAWHEAHPEQPGLTFDHTRNQANHLLEARFPLTVLVEDLTFSMKVKDAFLKLVRHQETRPRRIDYLWVRSDTVKLKVTASQLVGLPDEAGLAPSDHFGVCADIEVS